VSGAFPLTKRKNPTTWCEKREKGEEGINTTKEEGEVFRTSLKWHAADARGENESLRRVPLLRNAPHTFASTPPWGGAELSFAGPGRQRFSPVSSGRGMITDVCIKGENIDFLLRAGKKTITPR